MGTSKSTRKAAKRDRRLKDVTYTEAISAMKAELYELSARNQDEIVDALKEVVKDKDSIASSYVHMLNSCPLIYSFLQQLTENTYRAENEALKKNADPVEYKENAERRRTTMILGIFSSILRLRNKNKYSLQTALLSLQAFRTGMNRSLWRKLSKMGVLLSRTKTENLLKIMHGTKPDCPYQQVSTAVGLGCYDNCGYTLRHSYRKSDEPTKIFQTVNGYHIPINAAHHGTIGPNDVAFLSGIPHIGHLFDPDPDSHIMLLYNCINIAAIDNNTAGCFSYPTRDSAFTGSTHYVVHEALMNTNTASYDDNSRMLQHTLDEIRKEPSNANLRFIFVVGDQQTYDRMVNLLSDHRDGSYAWLIPMPGEFHVIAHVCHLIYRMFWKDLFLPLLNPFDRKHLSFDMKVEEFNTHEEFLLVVGSAVMDVFTSSFGPDCFKDILKLSQAVVGNKQSKFLLRFLVEYFFPYVAQRQLLRLQATPARRKLLNMFYPYWQSKFKTAGKDLYSCLCVDALHIYEALHPELQKVWDYNYTASMRGHLGHNMALDMLVEKVNLCCKQMIYGVVSEARIAYAVSSLNFMWPLETHHLEIMGLQQDNAQDHMGTSWKDDILKLEFFIRQRGSASRYEMTQTSDLNGITGSRFTNVYHPTEKVMEAQTEWRKWVDERLTMRHWN